MVIGWCWGLLGTSSTCSRLKMSAGAVTDEMCMYSKLYFETWKAEHLCPDQPNHLLQPWYNIFICNRFCYQTFSIGSGFRTIMQHTCCRCRIREYFTCVCAYIREGGYQGLLSLLPHGCHTQRQCLQETAVDEHKTQRHGNNHWVETHLRQTHMHRSSLYKPTISLVTCRDPFVHDLALSSVPSSIRPRSDPRLD